MKTVATLLLLLGVVSAGLAAESAIPSTLVNGQALNNTENVLFLFIGAVMVFSMHAGFAFLELGTVRRKNQVNALQKILVDWAVSTLVYFIIGYPIARGMDGFMLNAAVLDSMHGVRLVKFFFYLTFAACVPAIISGGIAERAKFYPVLIVNACLAGVAYPLLERALWWDPSFLGIGDAIKNVTGGQFTDFAGSVVVHSFGGWLALPAILLLGPRRNRYSKGAPSVSNIPFLALGSWILCIGWFGFNVVSAADIEGISGLVAVNSLMAMVGGILGSVLISKNDPGFTHNGALAGLIAICAGSAVVHPLAAFVIGVIAGLIFFFMFTIETERFKIDDVLGVWPLHGVVGSWGGIAAGIFGNTALFAAKENINFFAQLAGTLIAALFALFAGFLVFGIMKILVGIRLSDHDEFIGADRSLHNIEAYPEEVL
ncbi:MAG: ammonium transporter [Kiritimatiellaeota bacterium]|nr:ammonium transporter [Kiritimatiellota bacterium]